MSETNQGRPVRTRAVRHNGRDAQVLIYLGKQLRFFINENDWKVLPMAAIIAGLVGMVIRRRFFVNMEGSLIGAFALTCVAIWNGCFNSIQAVCRERAIIKREHRSGMHVSSYVAAHMIYQLLLCIAQTALTIYVLSMLQVPFPREGIMTPWMKLDIGITMLLITYAADMMSLFLSSISHTTTGAMTVMPFVLIFQLVFSGGIIPLPAWSQSLSNFTISNYGIRAMAAQSGYNERPMVTAWNTLAGMRNNEVGGTFTVGQVLDLLDSPGLEKYRDTVVLRSYTVGEAADAARSAEEAFHLRDTELTHSTTMRSLLELILTSDELSDVRAIKVFPALGDTTVESLIRNLLDDEDAGEWLDAEIGATVTLGQVIDFLHVEEYVDSKKDQVLNGAVTLGDVIDFIRRNEYIQSQRERTFTVKATVGELMDLFGEENVKQLVQERTAAASRKPEYDSSQENIRKNWMMLGLFAAVFAMMAMLALELIDKDKR